MTTTVAAALHALRRELVRESLAARRDGKSSAEADRRIDNIDAVLFCHPVVAKAEGRAS